MKFRISNIINFKFSRAKLVSLVLLLVVVSLPWSEKLNTYAIGLLIAVALYLLYLFKSFKKSRFKIFVVGASIFLISLLWLINTYNLSEGLFYLERTSSGILFPLVFLIIPTTLIQRDLILKGFAISVCFRYLYMLLLNLDYELVFIPDYWLEFLLQLNQLYLESDLHPSYFSVFIGFSGLIALYFFLQDKKRIIWLFIFLTLTGFNLTLAAKMPLAAYFITLFSYLIFRTLSLKKGKKKNFQLVLMAMTAGLLLIGLIKIPNFILQDAYNYYNLIAKNKQQDNVFDFDKLGNGTDFETWEKTNRVFIWATATKVISDNWLFGVGTGDVNDKLNDYYLASGFEYLERKNTNTHSQPLDFLLRFGVLGTFLILLAFIFFFKVIKTNNYVLYGIFMFFFVFAFLTENLLNRQLGIVFFHFFNNFFMNTAQRTVDLKKV
ncbi:O-antigen ligase family protein [Croceivirga thetidis]|uniref:O-antigen ligase family protein n=1 Tax=Croceivirga thetidis TaxID=2721623 RepID=A0ABX1GMP2_9FLAO|nr:O-antigen ligase family protein [Croceivirga thetidis]NKI31192.1 O-antigen ligase family protein [Croceivirga thetidis]